MVNIEKEPVGHIARDQLLLNTTKVGTKNLSREQKDGTRPICTDILERGWKASRIYLKKKIKKM